MMKHTMKVDIPIIQLQIDYTYRNIKKMAVLEATVLQIYNRLIKENDFKENTFLKVFQDVLKVDLPDVFLTQVLKLLINDQIFVIEDSSHPLLELSISSFSPKVDIDSLVKKKQSLSRPIPKSDVVYFNPILCKKVNKSDFVADSDNKKIIESQDCINKYIDMEQFKDAIIEKDNWSKDGVQFDVLDENKEIPRKVYYETIDIGIVFTHKKNYEFEVIFSHRDERYSNFLNKNILAKKAILQEYLTKNNLKITENNNQINVAVRGFEYSKKDLVITDNIELVDANVYILCDGSKKDLIEQIENNSKLMINIPREYPLGQKYPDSYIFENNLFTTVDVILVPDKYSVALEKEYRDNIIDDCINIACKLLIEKAMFNLSNQIFYEDIKVLKYIHYFPNALESINIIIEKLVELDVYKIIPRVLALGEVFYEDFNKQFETKIYSEYALKNPHPFDKIFNEWKFQPYNKLATERVQKLLLDAQRLLKKKKIESPNSINDEITSSNKNEIKIVKRKIIAEESKLEIKNQKIKDRLADMERIVNDIKKETLTNLDWKDKIKAFKDYSNDFAIAFVDALLNKHNIIYALDKNLFDNINKLSQTIVHVEVITLLHALRIFRNIQAHGSNKDYIDMHEPTLDERNATTHKVEAFFRDAKLYFKIEFEREK